MNWRIRMSVLVLYEEDGCTINSIDREFDIEFVKCEICFEVIGKVRLDLAKVPLSSGQIMPKSSNYPPIQYGDAEWTYIQCPYCHKRPFYNKDSFVNEKGETICLPQ